MSGRWELVGGDSKVIRHTGGGYQLVLECLCSGAEEWAEFRLGEIIEKLNQQHDCPHCGPDCDLQ